MNSQYKFFWGGIFSNWYKSPFTYNGVKYNTAEQFMMHQKALLFGDHVIGDAIMSTTHPSEQKALGRQIKNYDDAQWSEKRFGIVKEGVRAKFEQNLRLKKELVENRGYEFVEASPEDRIWGIGFNAVQALDNKSKWGLNLLGRLYTELANELEFSAEDAENLRKEAIEELI